MRVEAPAFRMGIKARCRQGVNECHIQQTDGNTRLHHTCPRARASTVGGRGRFDPRLAPFFEHKYRARPPAAPYPVVVSEGMHHRLGDATRAERTTNRSRERSGGNGLRFSFLDVIAQANKPNSSAGTRPTDGSYPETLSAVYAYWREFVSSNTVP